MDPNTRKIIESPLVQGVDEQVVYTLTTTPWGSSPSSPGAVLKNAAGADVSGTYLVGSAGADGDEVTTPSLNITAPGTFRLEIKFTISGNVYEAWAEVIVQE